MCNSRPTGRTRPPEAPALPQDALGPVCLGQSHACLSSETLKSQGRVGKEVDSWGLSPKSSGRQTG